jgi:transcriptional regulator with XRE-family HTH domain
MIRLKALRSERGWSGMELARQSGLSPSTISQIERQRFRPYDGQLAKLADALEWAGPAVELLEEVDRGPAS